MNRFFYATYIKTTPEQLWQALTSPEFTQRYWWGRKLNRTGKPAPRSRRPMRGARWIGKARFASRP